MSGNVFQQLRAKLSEITLSKAIMYHGVLVLVLSPGAFLYEETAPILGVELAPGTAFLVYLAAGTLFVTYGYLDSKGDEHE